MELETLVRSIKQDKNYQIPLGKIDFKLWSQWYRGNVKDIHEMSIWNGKNYIKTKLKSMQMAKSICEDWANLLMNEKCDIILPDENANEKMHKILSDTQFWTIANEAVEKSFALGLGAIVLSIDDIKVGKRTGKMLFDDAKIKLDFVDRFKITPLVVENKEIVEAAFTFKGSEVIDYIIHTRDEDGTYVINSFTYNIKTKALADYFTFNTKSTTAWFQIIRPFISNNDIADGYDVGLGMSVFANSLDTLHALDNKYDSFDNEFIAGRKKLHVSDEAWAVHNKKDGKREQTFNPMDTIYYQMPRSKGNEKRLLEDVSGELRAEQHIAAINLELNILSKKVGLGDNYYDFKGLRQTPTATQIVSENSQLYKSLKKHQILARRALINLAIVINEASKNFTSNPVGLAPDKYADIRIDFDDSIIEDKNAEIERDKGLVASGIMGEVEFRIKWLGEDEDLAQENYRKYHLDKLLNKYLPPLQIGAISPKIFVELVFGKADAELEKYIEEKLQSDGGFDVFNEMYEGD